MLPLLPSPQPTDKPNQIPILRSMKATICSLDEMSFLLQVVLEISKSNFEQPRVVQLHTQMAVLMIAKIIPSTAELRKTNQPFQNCVHLLCSGMCSINRIELVNLVINLNPTATRCLMSILLLQRLPQFLDLVPLP